MDQSRVVTRSPCLLAIGILATLGLGWAAASAEVVARVSVAPDGSEGNGDSLDPAISADGRIVAFRSRATNLVPGAAVSTIQVYVRDRVTATTELISAASDGTPATSDTDNFPALSANGRFVAFGSSATNLAAPCTTGISQMFVRDRIARTTECVSLAPDGSPGSGFSSGFSPPALSADGRFVAFQSAAPNLDAQCSNGEIHVFVRDRVAHTTTCVSVTSGGVQGNGPSGGFSGPALSGDGRLVVFTSSATNLAAPCANPLPPPSFAFGEGHIFLHDRVAMTTTCISVAPGGSEANAASFFPVLTPDGRFVAFSSSATNLDVRCPSVPPGPAFFFGAGHVYVRDRTTGITDCVSLATDGTPGNGASRFPAPSADGRFIAFNSAATNLAAPCTTVVRQVFVRDQRAGTTTCLSVNHNGEPSNGDSDGRGNSDGRFFAFVTNATNLLPGGGGVFGQIFVARLAVGPNWLVTGSASGGAPVRGFDAVTNPTLLALNPGFVGGVHVALGDADGDGAPDLVIGAGNAPGQAPRVRIFSGSTAGTLLVDFDANAGGPGGVTVAACDLEGTGRVNIVTGPGPGGGNVMRVWRFDPEAGSVSQIASFAAYADAPGGVLVACGRLDGPDSAPSIVTGPGAGSPPLVRIFTVDIPGATASPRLEFLAYPTSATGGVSVAVGDVRRGRAAIVTGPGPGFAPLVRVWTIGPAATAGQPGGPRQTGEVETDELSFTVGDPSSTSGVNVATGDTDGTGGELVVTGSGPGVPDEVTATDAQSDAPAPVQTITPPGGGGGGVVPAAPPATAGVAPAPVNPLSLQLSPTAFQPGDTLQLGTMVNNPGPPRAVDVYLGILLPPAAGPALGCSGRDAVVLVTGAGLEGTCLSLPGTFRPLAQGVTVPAGVTTVATLLGLVVPSGVPAGNYIAALGLTDPGTLNFVLLALKGFAIVP